MDSFFNNELRKLGVVTTEPITVGDHRDRPYDLFLGVLMGLKCNPHFCDHLCAEDRIAQMVDIILSKIFPPRNAHLIKVQNSRLFFFGLDRSTGLVSSEPLVSIKVDNRVLHEYAYLYESTVLDPVAAVLELRPESREQISTHYENLLARITPHRRERVLDRLVCLVLVIKYNFDEHSSNWHYLAMSGLGTKGLENFNQLEMEILSHELNFDMRPTIRRVKWRKKCRSITMVPENRSFA